VALLLAQASFGFAFSSFFLLPKFLATELDAGPAAIGGVSAAFSVTAVMLGPIMGALVDRRGRRPFMTAGGLLMAASSLGFVWVDSVGPLVYALRAAQGVAFAMAFVAGSALAVDEAPPERLAVALGIFGLTMLTNNALAPVVVEELALRMGWTPTFVLAAGAGLLCSALSLRVRDRHPPEGDQEIPRLIDVMRRPNALRIGVVIALAGSAFGAMFTFHQPFALELGIEQVRSFFVAYAAAAVAARLGLVPFTDRLGRRRVSIAALALYGGATVATAALDWLGLAFVGAAFGLAHGLFYPSFNALAVEDSGEHERGKVMALFNGAFNVGYGVGAFGLGLLAAAAGYPPVFLAAGLGAFVALAVLATGKRRRPETPARGAGGS
jgi:MFS family permease